MSGALQDVLVAIVTDARVLAAFVRDREAALSVFELDADERATLAALEPSAVERAARALLSKRESSFVAALPLTRRVVPSIGRRYRAWLATHAPVHGDHVLSPGQAEALRALDVLTRSLAADEAEAPYAADLLRYEVFCSCSLTDGVERRAVLGHAAEDIARALERGLVPVDPEPAVTVYVFGRGGARVEAR
jgi:hypothetical protein